MLTGGENNIPVNLDFQRGAKPRGGCDVNFDVPFGCNINVFCCIYCIFHEYNYKTFPLRS